MCSNYPEVHKNPTHLAYALLIGERGNIQTWLLWKVERLHGKGGGNVPPGPNVVQLHVPSKKVERILRFWGVIV